MGAMTDLMTSGMLPPKGTGRAATGSNNSTESVEVLGPRSDDDAVVVVNDDGVAGNKALCFKVNNIVPCVPDEHTRGI